jgi:hypothetical protein
LSHLPLNDSTAYVKIKEFLKFLFRSGNELYSWGDMNMELNPAKDYCLFNWLISTLMIDIQPCFPGWYEWALTHCESCCPKHHLVSANDINAITQIYSSSRCVCHEQSPYRPHEKWALQKTLIYAAHMFIGKSSTVNNWAAGLTSNNSTLSTARREKILIHKNYPIYMIMMI